MTKRMLSILLAVCLLLGVSLPAHAEDLEDEQSPVAVVDTLEELQTAIDEAEVGDTIAVAQKLSLEEPLETDKGIVITRADGYTGGLFYMKSGCAISGFTFLEGAGGSDTISIGLSSDGVKIKNCSFDGGKGRFRPYINVGGGAVNVEITDCMFNGNEGSALNVLANTELKVNNCTFTNNRTGSQGGAINCTGTIVLSNCTITDNTAASGGGIFCSGELTVSDCQFNNNSVSNENCGNDIFCTGTLSITDEMDNAAGYYEMTTGAKVNLPLVKSTSMAKLACFTTAEAEEFFAPKPPQELKAANIIELQSAISKANDGDTIHVTQPIWLDEGQDYTIGAPGKTVVLVFDVPEEDSVLFFTGSGEDIIELENLIITGNDTPCDAVIMGGWANQNITLNNVKISGFVCQKAPIVNRSNMTLTNCVFEENTGRYSGHVYHSAGTLEVSNCIFEKGIANGTAGGQGNGGAIHSAGTLHVDKSSFIDNSAKAAGAIYVVQLTECKISETSIVGNAATTSPGGGIYAGLRCNLSLIDCEIYGNTGIQGGNDLHYRGGDIEISYTKPLAEIYTTTEKVPYSWFSDSVDYESPKYDIPIKGRFDNKLQLKFYFEDEITVDDPDPEPTPEPTPTPDNDNPPQRPQEPPEDDDDDGEDYTPPKVEKPVQAPSTLNTATSADTPAQILKCGDAIIDTSRSVVLTGYGDGLLHEDDPLTRAQLATIIYRLLSEETLQKYQAYDSPFTDVDDGAWCARYIATLARAGIVNGTGNGEYSPDRLVTWAQVLAVLTRFVEPQEYELQQIQYNGWASDAVQTAVALNWIEDGADFNPNASISRGELVELINGVLEKY